MSRTLALGLCLALATPALAASPATSSTDVAPSPAADATSTPPAEATPPSPDPAHPFRALGGQIAFLEQKDVDKVNAKAAVLIGKLKDLGVTLGQRFDAKVSNFELGAAGPQIVALPKGLQAQVDLVSRDGDHVELRVRLVDADGAPVRNVAQAWHTSQGVTRQIPVAASGEVVVDALSVSPDESVQIYTGDGDVFVLWLDDTP